MKKYIIIFFLLFFLHSNAQEKIDPTNEITVTGIVIKETTVTINDLTKFQSHKINDLTITNHLGVIKGVAKDLKGVLLKDVLETIPIDEKDPKKLSECYFTFIASDGYKVVYSWNEIFNSETGNHIFLITEKEGKSISKMEERILLVTTSDFKTGRRHIKSLKKIIIARS